MLGNFIRTERQRRGWSQAVLAEKSGIAQTYISGMERGQYEKPGVDVLRGLAAAFDTSIDDLLLAASITPIRSIGERRSELDKLGMSRRKAEELLAHAEELTEDEWDDLIAQARRWAERHRLRQQGQQGDRDKGGCERLDIGMPGIAAERAV